MGRDVALRVWRSLLGTPAFLANVIESDPPIGGHAIVACGMGVFVDARFVDREIGHPAPGLNARILASVASGALLAAALDGQTDAELSADLGVSIEATKKRWLSIFERVESFKPEILLSAGASGPGRGPQKRHRVVAYVRAHPEELRPFSWDDTPR